MLVVYVLWNVLWLSRLQVPPALSLGLAGLPAPTTGITRGLCQLLQGNVAESLRWNAMTVPLWALFFFSLAWVGGRLVARRRPSLPRGTGWCWLVVLSLAWVLKLFGDRGYW